MGSMRGWLSEETGETQSGKILKVDMTSLLCVYRYPGTMFMDHVLRYHDDPNVKMVVVLGEVRKQCNEE